MRIAINDTVFCKIKGNAILPATERSFDIQLSFEVIGFDSKANKYLLAIPDYYSIKGCWTVQDEHIDKYNADLSHRDRRSIAITIDKIARLKAVHSPVDGLYCSCCKQFFPMAEPNQKDGTLICFSCRQNPY